MPLITVTFATPLFVFIILFTICLSFVAGCTWMLTGQVKKEEEEEAKKKSLLIDYRGQLIEKDIHVEQLH